MDGGLIQSPDMRQVKQVIQTDQQRIRIYEREIARPAGPYTAALSGQRCDASVFMHSQRLQRRCESYTPSTTRTAPTAYRGAAQRRAAHTSRETHNRSAARRCRRSRTPTRSAEQCRVIRLTPPSLPVTCANTTKSQNKGLPLAHPAGGSPSAPAPAHHVGETTVRELPANRSAGDLIFDRRTALPGRYSMTTPSAMPSQNTSAAQATPQRRHSDPSADPQLPVCSMCCYSSTRSPHRPASPPCGGSSVRLSGPVNQPEKLRV